MLVATKLHFELQFGKMKSRDKYRMQRDNLSLRSYCLETLNKYDNNKSAISFIH